MSASENARNAPFNDRRTSATLANKPRLPSSRVEARVRPGFPDDILPHDSISNAGKTKITSGSFRASGSSLHTTDEKLTERHKTTTNERVQLSSRSPLKPYGASEENAGPTKISRVSRPLTTAPERREKLAQLRFTCQADQPQARNEYH